MSHRAFTLIELLMVMIIVGILAAMAIPQFGKTTETAYQRQAQNMLRTIYAGERVFFSTNNRFCNPTTTGAPPSCSTTQTWAAIYMDDPATATTTYAFSSGSWNTSFTATATRTGVGGTCSARTMSITEVGGTPSGTWMSCP